MSWEESLQGWISKGLDVYAAKEAADNQNDAAYDIERLRLQQRNAAGGLYLEGQAGVWGGQGTVNTGSLFASTGGKVLMIGAAVLVVVLALRKG